MTDRSIAPRIAERSSASAVGETSAGLDLQQISQRLDRLPLSRFHAGVLVLTSASLLFDTVDSGITAFVLAALRTTWHFDVQTLGVVSAIGLSGYLVGSLSSQGKSLLFVLSDSVLLIAFLAVARFGPSTRGRRLEETSLGAVAYQPGSSALI